MQREWQATLSTARLTRNCPWIHKSLGLTIRWNECTASITDLWWPTIVLLCFGLRQTSRTHLTAREGKITLNSTTASQKTLQVPAGCSQWWKRDRVYHQLFQFGMLTDVGIQMLLNNLKIGPGNKREMKERFKIQEILSQFGFRNMSLRVFTENRWYPCNSVSPTTERPNSGIAFLINLSMIAAYEFHGRRGKLVSFKFKLAMPPLVV